MDPQGRVVGVIGYDIELVQLSTFLQSLKIGKHGLAFIMNDKKELVAYPDSTKVIDNKGETGKLSRCGSRLWITPALWRPIGKTSGRDKKNSLWRWLG